MGDRRPRRKRPGRRHSRSRSISTRRSNPSASGRTPGARSRVELDREHWLAAGTDGEVRRWSTTRALHPIKLDRGVCRALRRRPARRLRPRLGGVTPPARTQGVPDRPAARQRPRRASPNNVRATAEGTELLFINAVLLGPPTEEMGTVHLSPIPVSGLEIGDGVLSPSVRCGCVLRTTDARTGGPGRAQTPARVGTRSRRSAPKTNPPRDVTARGRRTDSARCSPRGFLACGTTRTNRAQVKGPCNPDSTRLATPQGRSPTSRQTRVVRVLIVLAAHGCRLRRASGSPETHAQSLPAPFLPRHPDHHPISVRRTRQSRPFGEPSPNPWWGISSLRSG
jgi:hypothetical protein